MIKSTLNNQLWQPALGPRGSMITEQASQKIKRNDFLHLPYLAGSNLNEGTSFASSLRNLKIPAGPAQDARFSTYIRQLLIDDSLLTPTILAQFSTMYRANDSTLGAPFNTGDGLFDRAAAWYTDTMFLGPRRLLLDQIAPRGLGVSEVEVSERPSSNAWVYHFRELVPGNDPSMGVSHGSELNLLFGPLSGDAVSDKPLSNQMRNFYINFIHDLDPGAEWKPFSQDTKLVLQILKDNVTMIQDSFNRDRTDFINSDKIQTVMQR